MVFAIHEKLLCDRIDYFAKAFRGGFKEAAEAVMHLPEESVDAFNLFVKWLYGARLPCGKPFDEGYNGDELKALCRLYMFAEKIADENLANETIDLIANSTDWETNTWSMIDMIPEVYEKTIAGCPLRDICLFSVAVPLYEVPPPEDNDIPNAIWEAVKTSSEMFKDLICFADIGTNNKYVSPSQRMEIDPTYFHCLKKNAQV